MKQRYRLEKVLMAGLILLLIMTVVSVGIGSYPLSFFEIKDILLHKYNDSMGIRVFYQLRLPRVLLGILAGGTLGIVGAVFQLLFHNPLAAPDFLGVSSGASLGAAIAIVVGTGSSVQIMSGAFLGGMSALILVLGLVKASGQSREYIYVLAGITTSALASALIMILKYMADTEGELAAIEFWTMGSLASVTAAKVMRVMIPIFISVAVLLLMWKEIVLLGLGDEEASHLGVPAARVKVVLLVFATMATSCVVSVTGVISFVGLLAPHLAYLLLGVKSRGYLTVSGIAGSILVVAADCFARTAKQGELPVSILTTLCAVPFLLYFMWKQRD